MRRRLTGRLIGCMLTPMLLLAAALLVLTAIGAPERLGSLCRVLVPALLVLTPASAGAAAALARRELRSLTEPLNRMDLQHPEETLTDRALQPLAEKIQEQNALLEAQMARVRAESANRESLRREFTANVSHELKTPLTTISGTAELLRSGMVKHEDVPHFADNIYRESQRLITLVSDILRLSQMEEPRVSVRWEPVDLYSVAGDVLGWLQSAAETRGVTLSLTGTAAVVTGSAKVLSDMIYNLCDNAVKYNRAGGWVRVSVRREGSAVCLRVEDNGIGIPPEHQERVFERFYRVDKSHSREIGGTGLGLSIVKHGAILHGADMTLRSEEGKGTAVTLRFPGPAAQDGEKGAGA